VVGIRALLSVQPVGRWRLLIHIHSTHLPIHTTVFTEAILLFWMPTPPDYFYDWNPRGQDKGGFNGSAGVCTPLNPKK